MESYCEALMMVVFLHSRSSINIIINYCSIFPLISVYTNVYFVSVCKCNTDIYDTIFIIIERRDGVVGIATGYGLDAGMGPSSSLGRGKNFLFSTSSRPALGPTHPPIQRVHGALSPGVKRLVREAYHTPTSTEVK
jgi:hypothetical protein